MNFRRPNRPYNQTKNYPRRENIQNFRTESGYNGNKQQPRENNTYTEDQQELQEQNWDEHEFPDNYEAGNRYENDFPPESWVNHSMSQPRYTLTNDQLMMLLKKQNKPKLRHSANVGKTLKDTSATHNNDILGMTSYFFISTVRK